MKEIKVILSIVLLLLVSCKEEVFYTTNEFGGAVYENKIASIAILGSNELQLYNGTKAVFDIRLNYYNSRHVTIDMNAIQLDKLDGGKSGCLINKPANFRISKIEHCIDEKGDTIDNDYRVTIEDLRSTASWTTQGYSNYNENICVSIVSTDEGGNKYKISSNSFNVRGYSLNDDGLSNILIHTPFSQPIVSKEDYVNDAFIYMVSPTAYSIVYSDTLSIKGRGNYTWIAYPKKPYKFKLRTKSALITENKSKKWNLLAEYTDKSLLRSCFLFEMSKACEAKYSVQYKYVNLYLNGEYQGIYLLTDQVERGDNRVNIKKDGFIIENNNMYATREPVYFKTKSKGFYYSFKYPDADDEIIENDENYNFIVNYMNDFETALYSDSFMDQNEGYRKYIDVNSFAKWYIGMELLGNWDPNYYYVLSSRNTKLEMYPFWDCEWSLGYSEVNNDQWSNNKGAPMNCDRIVTGKQKYFERLLQDPYFKSVVKDEWSNIKHKIPEAIVNVSQVKNTIKNAQKYNFEKWPIIDRYVSFELVKFATWEEETDFCFDYFNKRYEWFDNYINNF